MIDLIIDDFNSCLKADNDEKLKNKRFEDIRESKYNIQVREYLLELVEKSLLSRFIVDHRLVNFSELLLHFTKHEQIILMKSIDETFPSATGYNGWHNYDLFTNIAHSIYKNSDNVEIKNIALNIIKYCAENINRYHAQMILERLNY